MERMLSLVLDRDAEKRLILYKSDSVAMDEYTIKNFEDSEQIRKKYRHQIEIFLKENEDYLKNVSANYKRGHVVLLEENSFHEVKKVKILYKKHLFAFKEICKDRLTMQEFSRKEKIGYYSYGLKRLVSPHIQKMISYSGTFDKPSQLKYIEKELKKDKTSFYEIVRIMVKAYENQKITRPYLKTMEQMYKEHKMKSEAKKIEKKNLNNSSISDNQNSNSNKPFDDIQEKRYNIDGFDYDLEELHLFDLDDLIKMDTEFVPDGLGLNAKTKTFKRFL